MWHKELGKSGVLVPEIGLGTWGYRSDPAPLQRGFEAGAVFVDTAETYETESVIQEAVKRFSRPVFLATKISPQNFRALDFRRAVDSSLRRLGVSSIDLLQLHAPNPEVPIEETIGVMSDLVDTGKVRFIGVSNFSVDELQAAIKVCAKHRIVSNQVRYNLADRTIEGGLLQFCQANDITVIAYSPLGRDITRLRDADPEGVIAALSRETGKSTAQIALNWCVSKSGVIAIPKGTSIEHVLENCAASDWRLSPEQVAQLDAHIRFRRRNRFDTFVRRYTPPGLRSMALRAAGRLPTSVRRRLT